MQPGTTNVGSAGAGTGADSGTAPLGLQLQPLEELVRAMAAGNRGALSSVYEQTVAQVFAISRSMLRSKEDAEEVVCDVYTTAWQRAGSYDASRGTVMAWLAVMARNRAIDRLRQRRESLSLDDEKHGALAASLVGEVPGPEQLLAQ